MNNKQTKSYIEMMDSIYLKKKMTLTAENEKKVAETYAKSIKEVSAKLKSSKKGSLAESYYKNMAKSLYSELDKLQKETASKAATLAVQMNKELMEEIGWQAGVSGQFQKMFTNVPSETLQSLIAGGIYSDGKGLSARIWNHSQGASMYVQDVVNSGLARGQSAKEMAKALTKYVDPTKARTLRSKRAIEGLGAAYKHIEYNSLRLARTSISHSFTLGQKLAAKKNPFQDGFIWHSVFSHGRTCQECKDLDGTYFSVKNLPYDHPNGMCWNSPAYEKPLDYYAERIGNWANGGDDVLLEKWYNKEFLGMTAKEAKKAATATKGSKPSGAKLTDKQRDFRSSVRNYRRLQNTGVKQWEQEHYSKWAESLTSNERNAVESYTGPMYKWFNNHLRGIEKMKGPESAKIKRLIKALDKSEVPEDVVVYRGAHPSLLNSSGLNKTQIDELLKKDELHRLEGAVIHDKAFMSTSVIKENSFDGNLQLEIKVPAGSKGAFVRSLSHYPTENELLLQRGTRLRIESASKAGKIINIVAEVITQ